MKKATVLILAIAIVLASSACGQPPATSQSTTGPDGSAPESLSNRLSAEQADFPPVSPAQEDANASTEGLSLPVSAPNENGGEESAMTSISITVGDFVFSAKLYDNSAARALLAQLPMTLQMSDLNSNEKYHYLDEDLPSESTEKPATINAGDMMCWSGNCLVLFYKTFSNSYGGYVRLGYVEDASGFADVLGSGNVQVAFSVPE